MTPAAVAKKSSAKRVNTPRRARDKGVGPSALATLMGVSREAVRLWTVAGCPRRDDGSYIVAEVVTWRIARAVQAERDKDRDDDKPKHTSEMNRKLAVEADMKELQFEQMKGNLIPRDTHEAVTSRIAGGFAAVAAGQLARFERPIVQAKTPADARRVTQLIHTALMEGANGLADDLEAEADALDAEDAA